MFRFCLFALTLIVVAPAMAQRDKFPDWVQSELNYDASAAPKDAGVWRLLDETTLALRKDGRFQKTRRVVQVVLNERQSDAASIYLIDGNEDGSRIKKLKGWHLNSSGLFKKLDKDNVITVGDSSSNRLVSDNTTLALFERVGKGSIVAFESNEEIESFSSVAFLSLTNRFPVKKRVVILQDNKRLAQDAVLIPVNAESWGITYDIKDIGDNKTAFTASNLPAVKGQFYSRDSGEFLPRLMYGFMASDRSAEPLASWENMAKWYLKIFNEKSGGVTTPGPVTKEQITELNQFFRDQTSYKQRYLSLARGWSPENGELVAKRGYGDCKDFVSCMAYKASAHNVMVLPVMANTGDGYYLTSKDAPAPLFNHLIAAVPLQESLGFPAEVEANGKRYLLMDPTARYTRLGHLPGYYEDRNVLICTPEGAAWVAIPDSALEERLVTVKLMGALDRQQNMKGTMTVVEYGNAYGLRGDHLRGNPMDLEYGVRNRVGVPGVADLTLKYRELDENDNLRLTYQVDWPSFMRRDGHGFRLPRYMTGSLRTLLVDGDETREQPIYLGDNVDEIWTLELTSPHQFTPGQERFELKDDAYQFTWKATAGNGVNATFERRYNPVFYPRGELEAGAQHYIAFRQKFNPFWRAGMLFTAPDLSAATNL